MEFRKELLSKFPVLLLHWNRKSNSRRMPWKGEKEPYKIWLSEIILQQTRVEQGLKYYQKFVSHFPTIHKLAATRNEKVYKLWEGLGYYTRCKYLIETARFISKKLNGNFPDKFENILALKGVGRYTAAAIASFAYNLPYAVVDGNVFRVLSRVFGIKKPIASSEGKKLFTRLAFDLLDKKYPAVYNQALMDFGAVICKPYPLCSICPFKDYCFAFKNDQVAKLPVKEKRAKITTRWFNYLILEHNNRFYVRKRTGHDIWRNLNEFALIETEGDMPPKTILRIAEKEKILKKKSYSVKSVSPLYSQQLSHQKIIGKFIRVSLENQVVPAGYKLVSVKQMFRLAFPRIITSYFEKGLHND
ncbi:MAG TPA: A/G-specific adenine glycosylase [Chitinophagaceae bacterium]|nr:A/G-specific adenine glycosylase [Chitinophagaceae bacterium]